MDSLLQIFGSLNRAGSTNGILVPGSPSLHCLNLHTLGSSQNAKWDNLGVFYANYVRIYHYCYVWYKEKISVGQQKGTKRLKVKNTGQIYDKSITNNKNMLSNL